MQLSNLEYLPGYTITERLDVVYGSTVRSKHVGKDIFAGFKNIVGGELTAYTDLLEESRQEAIDRMMVKAQALGADAIVGLRFSTSSIAQGAAELFVYGTAVKVIPEADTPNTLSNDLPNRDRHGQVQTPTHQMETPSVPPLPTTTMSSNDFD